MTQPLGSMAKAWAKGLETWQLSAGFGSGTTGASPGVISGSEDGVKFLEPFVPRTLALAITPEAGQAALVQVVGLAPAMAKACMVGASSAFRYQGALAELFVRYWAGLMQAAVDRATGESVASPADGRVIADEMRALVRGISDAATREARRLEYDLAKVSETIARATDQATPAPYPYQHRRRHEMKS